VVRLAAVADCPANGIVTITEELIGWSAEREMSAAVPALPVLVVTSRKWDGANPSGVGQRPCARNANTKRIYSGHVLMGERLVFWPMAPYPRPTATTTARAVSGRVWAETVKNSTTSDAVADTQQAATVLPN